MRDHIVVLGASDTTEDPAEDDVLLLLPFEVRLPLSLSPLLPPPAPLESRDFPLAPWSSPKGVVMTAGAVELLEEERFLDASRASGSVVRFHNFNSVHIQFVKNEGRDGA